jgi:hypothetical protein
MAKLDGLDQGAKGAIVQAVTNAWGIVQNLYTLDRSVGE